MKKLYPFLPIFSLAPSLSIAMLTSDVSLESRPAKLFGFSLAEIDGHVVLSRSIRSSSFVEGILIWLPSSCSQKIIRSIDALEKPECKRVKATAQCPSTGDVLECWVYESCSKTAHGSPLEKISGTIASPPWEAPLG